MACSAPPGTPWGFRYPDPTLYKHDMNIRVAGTLTAVVLMLAVAPNAMAWGKIGHRVTGQIAQAHLSGQAAAAVEQILGAEDLAEASTWPDFMRSNQSRYWQRESGPLHYVTLPDGKTYAQVGAPRQGDAFTGLEGFRETLLDPDSTLEEQQLALRFIVHVIGDLHQPLHVGNGTDRGGNTFGVNWFGRRTNLHAVWDEDLVDHQKLSYTELSTWLMRQLTPEKVLAWWEPDPLVWIAESAAIRETVYPNSDDENARDRDLRWQYFYQHRDTMRERLTQGGIRMAAYLNALFAERAARLAATD